MLHFVINQIIRIRNEFISWSRDLTGARMSSIRSSRPMMEYCLNLGPSKCSDNFWRSVVRTFRQILG